MFTYTISEQNSISIFANGKSAPFLFQQTYPNGDTFDSKEEAADWAESFIASRTTEGALAPKLGKDDNPKKMPSKKELFDGVTIQIANLEAAGQEVPRGLLTMKSSLEKALTE